MSKWFQMKLLRTSLRINSYNNYMRKVVIMEMVTTFLLSFCLYSLDIHDRNLFNQPIVHLNQRYVLTGLPPNFRMNSL